MAFPVENSNRQKFPDRQVPTESSSIRWFFFGGAKHTKSKIPRGFAVGDLSNKPEMGGVLCPVSCDVHPWKVKTSSKSTWKWMVGVTLLGCRIFGGYVRFRECTFRYQLTWRTSARLRGDTVTSSFMLGIFHCHVRFHGCNILLGMSCDATVLHTYIDGDRERE